jgi:hypothetical protein
VNLESFEGSFDRCRRWFSTKVTGVHLGNDNRVVVNILILEDFGKYLFRITITLCCIEAPIPKLKVWNETKRET